MVEALIEPGALASGKSGSLAFFRRMRGWTGEEEATNRVHGLFSLMASSFGSNSDPHETWQRSLLP
jgi:hypothetical protein